MTAQRAPIAEEVLTEAEAVRRIPGRDAEVRAWLKANVRARRGPTGVRCYLWGEVLAALPLDEEDAPAPAPVRERPAALPRTKVEPR